MTKGLDRRWPRWCQGSRFSAFLLPTSAFMNGGMLTRFLLFFASIATVLAQGEPNPRDIVLLIGQSNMAGRGKIEEQDKVPHPRIFKQTEDKRWVPAVDPLHFDKPELIGVGLGSSFARA